MHIGSYFIFSEWFLSFPLQLVLGISVKFILMLFEMDIKGGLRVKMLIADVAFDESGGREWFSAF